MITLRTVKFGLRIVGHLWDLFPSFHYGSNNYSRRRYWWCAGGEVTCTLTMSKFYQGYVVLCGSGLKLMVLWDNPSENIFEFHPLDWFMGSPSSNFFDFLPPQRCPTPTPLAPHISIQGMKFWYVFREIISYDRKLQTATTNSHVAHVYFGHRGGAGDFTFNTSSVAVSPSNPTQ